VHTGPDSKLIMNLGQYRFKRSRFETVLNYVLVFNLLLAIVFAVCGAVMNAFWTSSHIDTHLYIFQQLDSSDSAFLTSFKVFFSMYLIVNSFVPLDLLVALEISKLVYTPFFDADAEMMVPDYITNDIKGMECHSLTLHEELGLVEYIFCDKTGTLTQNELVFRQLALPDGTCHSYNNTPLS